ncbi:hypothetical protein NXY55_25120, partial [Aeromonas veronii]|nr:hypothetical protein [Aeromonas veronii]
MRPYNRFFALFSMLLMISLAGCGKEDIVTNVGKLDFEQPLKLPPLVEPIIEADGTKNFTLTMQTGETELLPGKITETWGIN